MRRVRPDRADLDAACAAGLLQPAQGQPLLAFLQARALLAAKIGPAAAPATPPAEPLEAPRVRLTHVLYYQGGLIAIGAMTLCIGMVNQSARCIGAWR